MQFQPNAWSDEKAMKDWIIHQWKPACQEEMLLVLDVHRAQKTKEILGLFKEKCKTDLIFVPPGDDHCIYTC